LTRAIGSSAAHEQNAVVDVVNSVPEEKRSPWSTEGFGGRYQKVRDAITELATSSLLLKKFTVMFVPPNGIMTQPQVCFVSEKQGI
jgi:hypothetical protein